MSRQTLVTANIRALLQIRKQHGSHGLPKGQIQPTNRKVGREEAGLSRGRMLEAPVLGLENRTDERNYTQRDNSQKKRINDHECLPIDTRLWASLSPNLSVCYQQDSNGKAESCTEKTDTCIKRTAKVCRTRLEVLVFVPSSTEKRTVDYVLLR